MKNTPELHFENEKLFREYQAARRFFNLSQRTAPEPYFPPQIQILTEAELLKPIEKIHSRKNLSIYLHIPFCNGKCTFCDLYSFHIPPHRYELIENYTTALAQEIQLWGKRLEWLTPTVTTVHFGGGSPLVLNTGQLTRLLNLLQRHFPLNNETEFAIEITTSQITPANIKLLEELNIRRVHVGVQTLLEPARQLIGRRESSAVVKEKLKMLLSPDFITSVDLLYGLPFQTADTFQADLDTFIEMGVDGFALYELQITRRLENALRNHPNALPDKLQNYRMVLQGKARLNQAGYQNVFFNHYGNPRDRNLYFTFPERDEDCLAVGTIADGRLANICWRHHKFKQYLLAIGQGNFGIAFGYVESTDRSLLRQLESYLMSTRIPDEFIKTFISHYGPSFQGIWDLWQQAEVVRVSFEDGDFELTGSGCWLLSTLFNQIRRLTHS